MGNCNLTSMECQTNRSHGCTPRIVGLYFPASFADGLPTFLAPLGGGLERVGDLPLGEHIPQAPWGGVALPLPPVFNQGWPMLPLGQRPKDADSSRDGQPEEEARRNWDIPVHINHKAMPKTTAPKLWLTFLAKVSKRLISNQRKCSPDGAKFVDFWGKTEAV